MPDTVVRLGDTLVQHGPFSDRVYVMKMAEGPVSETLDQLDALVAREGYGKVVVKARAPHRAAFEDRGYRLEATVPGFFGRDQPALFLGKFIDAARAVDARADVVRQVLSTARGAASGRTDPTLAEARATLPGGWVIREPGSEEAPSLASFYGTVFRSYPFPIDDPEHIRAAMSGGTRFFAVVEGDRLVAASSMEPGGAPRVVEMTDFATLSDHRGSGLATHLLGHMDAEAEAAGVRVAFTIARATSFGMNITFARRGYEYGGTLVNNTQISGGIESMNVWFKPLRP